MNQILFLMLTILPYMGIAQISCNPPTNLNVTSIGYDNFAVSWTAGQGITYYVFEYQLASASTASSWITSTSPIQATNYSIVNTQASPLAPNTAYRYRVKSFCYPAKFSTELSGTFTTLCNAPPTGVVVQGITTSSAKLVWNFKPQTSHCIQYRPVASTTSASWSAESIVNGAPPYFDIYNLNANTLYEYRIRIICNGIYSPYITGTFKTLAHCTSAPAVTGLTYSIVNNGFPGTPTKYSVNFTWTPIPNFSGTYTFKYKLSGQTNFTTHTGLTSPGLNLYLPLSFEQNTTIEVNSVCGNTNGPVTSNTQVTLGCEDIYEPNNEVQNATPITESTPTVESRINYNGDVDFYSYTISEVQRLRVVLDNFVPNSDRNIKLYYRPNSASPFEQAGTGVVSQPPNVYGASIWYGAAPAGDYLIKVYGNFKTAYNSNCYSLTVLKPGPPVECVSAFGPAEDYYYESNNTIATAYAYQLGQNLYSKISPAGDIDYYKFKTDTIGTINVSLTQLPANYKIELIDGSGTAVIGSSTLPGLTSETIIAQNQPAGSYFVKVSSQSGASHATSCYNLKVTLSSMITSNKSKALVNTNGKGSLEIKNADELKLIPNPASKNVTLSLIHDTEEAVNLKIYDQTGREVHFSEVNLMRMENRFDLDISNLNPGLYYVQMQSKDWVKNQKLTIIHK